MVDKEQLSYYLKRVTADLQDTRRRLREVQAQGVVDEVFDAVTAALR